MDMTSIKEMIQCATLGIPKGMKNAISISIAFCLDFLIRNENITSEECKTKNCLKYYCINYCINIAYRASYKPSNLGG